MNNLLPLPLIPRIDDLPVHGLEGIDGQNYETLMALTNISFNGSYEPFVFNFGHMKLSGRLIDDNDFEEGQSILLNEIFA